MEPFDTSKEGDLGALSADQQKQLNQFKVRWQVIFLWNGR